MRPSGTLWIYSYYLFSRQGLPNICWSFGALEDCVYLMWGRSYCSSLQGESEMESQYLRPHLVRKDTLLKEREMKERESIEKLGWWCLLPPKPEGDPQGILSKPLGKLVFSHIPVTGMQSLAGIWWMGYGESWGKEVQFNSQYFVNFFYSTLGIQKMWMTSNSLGFPHTSKILKQQGVILKI